MQDSINVGYGELSEGFEPQNHDDLKRRFKLKLELPYHFDHRGMLVLV